MNNIRNNTDARFEFCLFEINTCNVVNINVFNVLLGINSNSSVAANGACSSRRCSLIH